MYCSTSIKIDIVALFGISHGTKSPEKVVKVMREQVSETMEAYDQLEEAWKDKGRFLELMTIDSCFLFGGEC